MNKLRGYLLIVLILFAAGSCRPAVVTDDSNAIIFPDYQNVTVPAGIAPLNFDYTVPADKAETVFSAGGCEFRFKGPSVRWRMRDWRRILDAAAGGEIDVSSSVSDGWKIYVSEDEIDYGLNYRLLEPGYEVYSKMGIYERDLRNFRQKSLLENTDFSGCVNCHAYNRGDPSDFSLHIRGDHGATIIRKNGEMAAYNTKTDHSLGFCVYPYWHPDGRFLAYSTNNTRQLFHVQPDKTIEVFDLASDVQIYDTQSNRLMTPECLKDEGKWETFPAFSADGGTLYFCMAYAVDVPDSLSQVRYDLYKVTFDSATGEVSESPELVIDASSEGHSISFPKPSYDGRYLIYTRSDYGQFSIWHHEADLWLLDIRTGETRPLDEVNSLDTESYHGWSSNSSWIVFSSRRVDGLFTRLYIAHVGSDGSFGKPFLLPQRNPARYYSDLFMSYNVPEFVTRPVDFDYRKARRLINSPDRVPFE